MHDTKSSEADMEVVGRVGCGGSLGKLARRKYLGNLSWKLSWTTLLKTIFEVPQGNLGPGGHQSYCCEVVFRFFRFLICRRRFSNVHPNRSDSEIDFGQATSHCFSSKFLLISKSSLRHLPLVRTSPPEPSTGRRNFTTGPSQAHRS